MLTFPSSVRILLCTRAVDLRKSFDGLAELVRQALGDDPLNGHLFVFRNRVADRLKLLYWDRDGYALWYKRLEQGTFRFPLAADGSCRLEVNATDFALLLDGIDLDSVRRRHRYHRPQPA
jgi:transposase